MILINLEDTFVATSASEDFKEYTFDSTLTDKSIVSLKVEISSLGDPLLPNVYNLAFGPLNAHGAIDDTAKLKHSDTGKVFSTIILFAITFLQEYPDTTIGIDGSNDVRAFLYHRMFIKNYESIKEYVITIGVDWYVRLLRNGSFELDNNGLPFFKPKPEPFDLQRSPQDLYRYYMLNLNT
jgi:hypothetical protein